MTDHQTHVTEDDLILHYYGEAPDRRARGVAPGVVPGVPLEFARLNRVLRARGQGR